MDEADGSFVEPVLVGVGLTAVCSVLASSCSVVCGFLFIIDPSGVGLPSTHVVYDSYVDDGPMYHVDHAVELFGGETTSTVVVTVRPCSSTLKIGSEEVVLQSEAMTPSPQARDDKMTSPNLAPDRALKGLTHL